MYRVRLFLFFSFACIPFSAIFLFSQEVQTVVIKPGQTLWDISNKYLKDPTKWDILVKYNNLSSDPLKVLPGMTIKVPVELLKDEYRAAKFIEVLNDVRFRKKEASQWLAAKKNFEIFNGDTVRTNSNSTADIKFHTGQVLNVFENSMLVVRPAKEKGQDIRLMSGQIRTINSRVITPTAKIVPKGSDTEFGAKIKEDLSTIVEVYKGEAKVSSHQGSEISLKAGFSTQVRLNSKHLEPVKMEKIETLKEMKTRIVSKYQVRLQTASASGLSSGNAIRMGAEVSISTSDVAVDNADVKLKMEKTPIDSKEVYGIINMEDSASGYRIQASVNKNFEKIVFDKKYDVFTKPNLSSDLPKGVYWVRYAMLDLLGDQGKYSEPTLVIVR